VYQLLLALAGHWSNALSTHDAEFDAERFVKIAPAQFHEAGLLKLSCDKALYSLRWRPTLDFPQTAELTASWFNAYYQQPDADMLSLTQAQMANYVAKAQMRGIAWAQR
jgi:hypothetical protein